MLLHLCLSVCLQVPPSHSMAKKNNGRYCIIIFSFAMGNSNIIYVLFLSTSQKYHKIWNYFSLYCTLSVYFEK